MNRYFLYLSYMGAKYSGWQIQPNAVTVQETLEKALATLLRVEIPIVGAGRTDAGVHARTMVAHFDADIHLEEARALAHKLNVFLPNDIAIQGIKQVKADAHARFDATSRLYRYYISTEKNPFRTDSHYRLRGDLNLEAMNTCAQLLFEYDDFTSFSKLHTDVKTNLCKIMVAEWEQTGSEYVFTIQADRFLRNMVRAIVGTLIEVGRGKIGEREMRRIIESKDRGAAGSSVPGHALYLEGVEYPDSIFEL